LCPSLPNSGFTSELWPTMMLVAVCGC
jgi:hypothetical protein